MKKTLNIECPCGHWNTLTFDTVFFEPPLPEPKVRMMKRMYKPLKETRCPKCGRVIAKPEELFENSLRRGPLRFAQTHLDPLWLPKLYLRNLIVKAMYIVLEGYKFVETRAELIDIIGEDAFRLVQMLGKQLEKLTRDEIEYLKMVPPKRRGRILKKLKRTR